MFITRYSRGREEDRIWEEECPYCGGTPDGYGTCEACGEWTSGWWVPIKKGERFEYFERGANIISPCDGIASVAIEDRKPLVLHIKEYSCAPMYETGRKFIRGTHYVSVPVRKGESEEEIASRAMEKFLQEFC